METETLRCPVCGSMLSRHPFHALWCCHGCDSDWTPGELAQAPDPDRPRPIAADATAVEEITEAEFLRRTGWTQEQYDAAVAVARAGPKRPGRQSTS